MQPLLIITGATAVGKTALTLSLAEKLKGEVISADSMQVYRGMDIGTAKPTPAEMGDIPHHLIDIADPRTPYDVAQFVSHAAAAIADIAGRGKTPILSGGTGLYISCLIDGADFTHGAQDIPFRQSLENVDTPALAAQLAATDPAAAAAIHPNNRPRIIRALEYYRATGQSITAHKAGNRPPPYRTTLVVLGRPREELYRRIDQRVDDMLSAGLVAEVQQLLGSGVSPKVNAMQGLGYKELVWYLSGQCTYGEAVELLKRNTRRYAKRQLTWWRRRQDAIWLPADIDADTVIRLFGG